MTNEEAINELRNMQKINYTLAPNEVFELAIEALENYDGVAEALNGYAELYRKLKEKYDNLKEQTQWIPCSEKLPKQNGVYIVTRAVSDGFEYHNITDACYFDGSNVWHDDTRVNHGREYLADVIAWMPKPKPWKGEQNE